MTTTKRAYKLQEFVAHSSSVNCLKIGRKSSRILVTGGEDHKVNLWSIGKPNAILSLSGHSSGIDSVNFDSSEVLVAAGAASGTIKLWDLEEAKIVRTLTGHRSNCISLDFHPFGEFFASGSLDTNLKIWDIRKKGCIHTYKGHTSGINAIRFTPDGRWVVSGGEDHTVKLWDLTAGKLMHEFKCHEGQIQCIEFHPHEFLLATGSADRTVKFWDLETFELIGSAGPETSGVRSMTFNPDGKTLLCGLHENMKVISWEPIRCHDTVDVGWSKLSDLNVHEGKLLGCSYNQSCVGVWVVDISRIEPYTSRTTTRLNGHSEVKSNSSATLPGLDVDSAKSNLSRLSISQNSDPVKETKSCARLSAYQNPDIQREPKPQSSIGNIPGTPQRINPHTVGQRSTSVNSVAAPNMPALKRNSTKVQLTSNASALNRSEVMPVIVPRNNLRLEQSAEPRKEGVAGHVPQQSLQFKTSDLRKFSNAAGEPGRQMYFAESDNDVPNPAELSGVSEKNIFATVKNSISGNSASERSIKDDKHLAPLKLEICSIAEPGARNQHENYESRGMASNKDAFTTDSQRRGRTRPLVANWDKRERASLYEGFSGSGLTGKLPAQSTLQANKYDQRGQTLSTEKEMPLMKPISDEDFISNLMEQHDQFVDSMQTRLAKLQVVCRYWQRNDIKGALGAMEKMADHAVLADVLSFMTKQSDIITFDICTSLLPLLSGLLGSNMDRHQDISLEMLLKLVKVFGSMIYSSMSAPASVGVDIEAEQRLERCNLCYVELEKVKYFLPTLTRRGGSIAKSTQELSLLLKEFS
ncbi:unnamed protein product [Cuscuta europaea]|uniref:Katanin p80 WD40 repeat-containing subunit B1 homolog n=1 Tax=Cuscuta europaea TaxID=41803 RepID=A0A9P0Z6G6_CUSEU|nr:unnamed protein product [Cuscuta europaea]